MYIRVHIHIFCTLLVWSTCFICFCLLVSLVMRKRRRMSSYHRLHMSVIHSFIQNKDLHSVLLLRALNHFLLFISNQWHQLFWFWFLNQGRKASPSGLNEPSGSSPQRPLTSLWSSVWTPAGGRRDLQSSSYHLITAESPLIQKNGITRWQSCINIKGPLWWPPLKQSISLLNHIIYIKWDTCVSHTKFH